MVGRDGVVAGAALNGRVSLNRAIVQVERIRTALSSRSVKRHSRKIFSYSVTDGRLTSKPSRAGAAVSSVQRYACDRKPMSRWLLRAADLHGRNELPITQEYIAQNVGRSAYKRHRGCAHFAGSGNDPLQAWSHKVA